MRCRPYGRCCGAPGYQMAGRCGVTSEVQRVVTAAGVPDKVEFATKPRQAIAMLGLRVGGIRLVRRRWLHRIADCEYKGTIEGFGSAQFLVVVIAGLLVGGTADRAGSMERFPIFALFAVPLRE